MHNDESTLHVSNNNKTRAYQQRLMPYTPSTSLNASIKACLGSAPAAI